MKTHVINLQRYDDIHSVSDQLKWVKSDRVLIVMPIVQGAFGSRLDLVRLKRMALSRVVTLGVVTVSKTVRDIANELSIPVFSSQIESRRKPWCGDKGSLTSKLHVSGQKRTFQPLREKQIKKTNLPLNPLIRSGVFFSGLASVAVLLFILLPRAEIVLHPKERVQMLDISLNASSEYTSADVTGNIPLHSKVEAVQVLASSRISSQRATGVIHATGDVEIRNLSQEEIDVPANSRILIDGYTGHHLITLEKGILLPGQSSAMTLKVRCEPPGSACNIKTGTSLRFIGALADQVQVELVVPLTGGKDQDLQTPDEADWEALRERLILQAKEQLISNFDSVESEGILILNDEYLPTEITYLTDELPADDASSRIVLGLEVRYEILYIYRKDVKDIAQAALAAILQEGWESRPGTLYWELLSETDDQDGIFSFKIRAAQLIHEAVDETNVAKLIAGKPRGAANHILEASLDLRQAPQMKMPAIYFWLPLLPANIDIEVK